MRTRYLLAAVVAGLTTAAASAQTTGTTGATGSTGLAGGNNNSGGNSGGSNFQIQQQQQAPSISGAAVSASNALAGTNNLRGYYANPYTQGQAGSTGNDAPGGFGVPLSGGSSTGSGRAVGTAFSSGSSRASSTGGTTGRNTTTSSIGTSLSGGTTSGLTGVSSLGSTAGRTGATGLGTTGGFGATGGLGRTGTTGLGTTGGLGRTGTAGGLGTIAGQGGTIIPLPRQITYTATLRMPMPAINVPQQTTELRGVLDRSSMIANPRGIQVETNGPVVVLRGTVKDEEEAKTAEGIIRLTPGVKDVKNELKY